MLDDVAARTAWRRLLEGSLGIPATEGNHVEVLRDGVEIFPAMLDAIDAATRTVDLLTFVYWRGDIARRFADTLCGRAARGVRCRVILDAVGARHVDDELISRMEHAGVLIHWFRPVVDRHDVSHPGYRTHRKVLICDEQVGFVGGIGIAEEWDGTSDDGSAWRETQLRVRGPVVDGLRAAFLDDWFDSDHQLVDHRDRFPEQPGDGATTAMAVRGESEHGRNDIALLRHVAFLRAQRRIRITTPYVALDERTRTALVDAAARGVQVQLLVPGPSSDKQIARLATERHYRELLTSGIEVHEFRPIMLHAKVTTFDGEVAIVGSANLNHRSLRLDEELDVVVFDPEVVRVLDRQTDEDLQRCAAVTLDDLVGLPSASRAPLRMLSGLIHRWV